MKRLYLTAISVALAALVTSSKVQAQNAKQTPSTTDQQLPAGENTNEKQPHSLGEELKLTEQQRTNVLAVFEQMHQKMEAFAQELSRNADIQLKRILTPEQYQKLLTLSGQHEHQFEDSASQTNAAKKISR